MFIRNNLYTFHLYIRFIDDMLFKEVGPALPEDENLFTITDDEIHNSNTNFHLDMKVSECFYLFLLLFDFFSLLLIHRTPFQQGYVMPSEIARLSTITKYQMIELYENK